jgi:hypothetical protein
MVTVNKERRSQFSTPSIWVYKSSLIFESNFDLKFN